MRKRIIVAVALMVLFLVGLSSCSHNEENYNSANTDSGGMSLASFSYADESALYEDGDAGVKTADFFNVDTFPVDNQASAVERAKNECTIEYNATSEYYDNETGMWRIDFMTLSKEQGTAIVGNCQSVYLDSDGITHLIVYGE